MLFEFRADAAPVRDFPIRITYGYPCEEERCNLSVDEARTLRDQLSAEIARCEQADG